MVEIKKWLQSSWSLMLGSGTGGTNATFKLECSFHHLRSLAIWLQCLGKSFIGRVTEILMNLYQLVLFPFWECMEIGTLIMSANFSMGRLLIPFRVRSRSGTWRTGFAILWWRVHGLQTWAIGIGWHRIIKGISLTVHCRGRMSAGLTWSDLRLKLFGKNCNVDAARVSGSDHLSIGKIWPTFPFFFIPDIPWRSKNHECLTKRGLTLM